MGSLVCWVRAVVPLWVLVCEASVEGIEAMEASVEAMEVSV